MSLDSKAALTANNIAKKIIPLNNVIDVNFAQCDMVMWKPKNITIDDLEKKPQTCLAQGTVSCGTYPKLRQIGEDDSISFKYQYLCVKINEAKVFGDINDGGDPVAWVEVVWGGVKKKSKIFKREFVNQTLFFKIPLPPHLMKD